ncbi:type I secretion target repeat protein [Roseibacterium elongatum DSM 19469]|uniref:Type I secretion target repeat protein n=1 Tax=Roseicyclus elongatus DSM 19469 TaxID=1294273 RepID=W8S7Y9_9RHOB|nr:Hint domain-containing protein [Roseibacterium elongatum]AHM05056.1 type I secretion target repeat protein [Roseibacterium elongatum DSM 19469]
MSTSDTQSGSDTGTINGIDVGLTATLPTFATDTFDVSADITTGALSQDINVALVIDTSGSTAGDSGSDVDGDGINDTYLAAQQAAAKALFQSLLEAGYNPEDVTVTLIEYNNAGQTVGNFTLSQQDAFETAVDGLDAGGGTNFDDALDEVLREWRGTTTDGAADDSPPSEVTADDTNLIVFLSDGRPTVDGTNFNSELAAIEAEFDADITAIGVGANSSLTQLEVIDNTGTATQVTDLSQLADVINTPPPLPDLQEIQILVNGSVIETIPADDPRIITTPLGYRLSHETVTGYPYVVGETLDVAVRAVFHPTGDTLTVDGLILPLFICFVAGTRILTPEGPKPIECLAPGDLVMTRDHGLQAIRWIGSTTLPDHALAHRPEARPVRISAGALGHGLPERDLLVSRQHRILIHDWRAELFFAADDDGVLTPAFSLVNDTTIRLDRSKGGVTYVHMAFARHEVVYAEGVEAESFHPYAKTVGMLAPAQRAELFALFPDLAEGEAYPSARRQLRGRDGRVFAAASPAVG